MSMLSGRGARVGGKSVWILVILALPAVGAELEEVVVTAQKREQSLQDVGISATAFTADQIAELSMKNIGDALAYSPNIQRTYGPSGSQDGFFFFRGIGQQDILVTVDPGVAVYIDDVYLGRLQGASFDVLDIQRLELLRGPQGTLFGRNAVGGAVSAHTRDPGDNLAFNGRLTLGGRNRSDIFGTIDAPITDGIRATASLFSKHQDGWVTNQRDSGTLGDVDTVGGRLKVLWEALDNLSLRLSGDYSSNDGTSTPMMLTAVNPDRLFGALAVPLPTDLAADIVNNPFGGRTNVSVDPTFTSKRGGVSLAVDWDAGSFNLKSITAWRKLDQVANTDLDGGPYSTYDALFTYDQHQISQELQFTGTAIDDRLHWLVGPYYFHENVAGFTGLCAGNGKLAVFAPSPPPFDPGIYFPGQSTVRGDGLCYRLQSDVDLTVDAWAGFSNLDFAVTDKLSAIVGYRYTHESKNQDYSTATDDRDNIYSQLFLFSDFVKANPIALPGQLLYDVSPKNPNLAIPYQYHQTWNNSTYKLGLNYSLTDATLLYASYSTGFKSGGFGGRNTPGEPFQPYDPETIDSWEAGVKTELFDRRLRLDFATFYSNYNDIQVLVIGSVQGGDNLFITANGGSNRIRGFELEAQAQPTESLNLSLGVGYLSTEWTSLRHDAGEIPMDGDLPQSPTWTLSSAARYTFNLGAAGDLTVGADYSYRSSFYFDAENRAGQGAYGLVNVRATHEMPNSHFTVSLYGLNVLNEKYFYTRADSLDSLGIAYGVPAPLSEWGVEVAVKFD